MHISFLHKILHFCKKEWKELNKRNFLHKKKTSLLRWHNKATLEKWKTSYLGKLGFQRKRAAYTHAETGKRKCTTGIRKIYGIRMCTIRSIDVNAEPRLFLIILKNFFGFIRVHCRWKARLDYLVSGGPTALLHRSRERNDTNDKKAEKASDDPGIKPTWFTFFFWLTENIERIYISACSTKRQAVKVKNGDEGKEQVWMNYG